MGKYHRVAAAVVGVMLSGFVAPSMAQSAVTPEDEYKKLVRVNEEISPLGDTPFGERIDLYSGSLSFEQTDVSLPGDGPLLRLSRTFELHGREEALQSSRLGFPDWELNIPRIATLTSYSGSTQSWQVNWPSNPDARCTHFGAPPTVSFPPSTGRGPWSPSEWWNGYHMIIPGAGNQELLRRSGSNTLSPTMPGKTFPIVTKQHWMIDCLSSTANGQPGEAFLAVSPDGTKYWFDHLVYGSATTIKKPANAGPDPLLLSQPGMTPLVATENFLDRRVAWMLVTRIEDRFGNSLDYSYDGSQLTAIEASDGRKVSLSYSSGRLTSVTLNPLSSASRTWTYLYYDPLPSQRHALKAVVLPDGTQWSFDLRDLAYVASVRPYLPGDCDAPAAPTITSWTGIMTHPSGLQGTFTVTPKKRGRSYVGQECWGGEPGVPMSGYALIPNAWYALAVTGKTFSGAGLSGGAWQYVYSSANESWTKQCGSTSCPTTVSTDVKDPDGHTTRYIFSNRFDYTEGKLQRTYYYSSGVGSAIVRLEENAYAEPTSGPWPDVIGDGMQTRVNSAQTKKLSPLRKRELTQEGNTYTWLAKAFNTYGQVTKTKRFNDIAGTINESGSCPSQSTFCVEEQTSYLNDRPHWVLGLPKQFDNLTAGETVSKYVYDLADVTLQQRWAFGRKVMDYTFNSAGQLVSFSDGRGNTTILGNYQRGIPQTINYPPTVDQPSGTSQSLSVDDFGQIASITDQAGETTSYSYDAAGRLTGITYPADSVAWYPKSFTYAYVTGAERGLGGGHWRRTVSTGNARQVTYFDVLMRPVLSDTYIYSSGGSSTSHSNVRTGYNWKGQTVLQSWPKGDMPSLGALTTGTHTTYDALGRVTQVTQDSELGVLETGTAYLSGARRQVTDPKGHLTTTSYQVFDQPGYQAVTKVQAPEALAQTITRDLYGNPISITQSGTYGSESVSVTRSLFYDDYKRLCRTTEPESGSTVMDYDAANNLAWSVAGFSITGTGCGREQIPAAARITRTYNAMNRLKEVTYPDGISNTEFTYDVRGNVQTATSGPTLWTYTRNARGLLTGETLAIDGYVWPIGYAYDRYGTVTAMAYPDGKPVAFAPDALGRPSQAGPYVTSVAYHPDGDIEYFMLGNGTEYLAEKNDRHLLSSLNYEGSNPRINQDLTYDKNANLTVVNDLVDGTRNKVLSYDALNRLTQAKAVNLWGTETYTYDPLNNLRSLGNRSHSYDTHNRLNAILSGSATLHSFTYDARGNAIQKDGQVRVFDQANRLTQIMGTESYVYDAAGRRVKKTPEGASPVYYAYNSAGRLLWEYVPTTTTTGTGSDYVYLESKLVAKLDRNISTMPPAAPASITVPATSGASLSVHWAASSYAVTYRLQQQKDAGNWATVYAGESVSRALTLAASGTYVYRVAACNGAGCSGYTTSSPVAVTVPPSAAPPLTVPGDTSTTGDYTVSWAAVSGAATYTLQEQKDSGSWSTAHDGGSRSKALIGKATGTWGYRVRACNVSGCGPWSDTKTVTVLLPPPVPASITVPATSSGSVATDWSSATTAASYKLQHRKGSGSWSQVYSGSAIAKTVVETSTGSYTYRVQACNASGCSGWRTSSAVVVTIPPASAPSLTVPSISSTGGYTVSWGSVSGAATYTLQEKKNSGSWSNDYSGSRRSKAFSGKTNGADYSYRVRAHNAGGNGPWSDIKMVTIAIPPPVPGNVLAIDEVVNSKLETLTIDWSAASGASHYEVKQNGTGTVVYSGAGTSVQVESMDFPAIFDHSYAVRSCNAYACSVWVQSQYTVAKPKAAPSITAPSGSSSGSYTVSWGSVTGATSYVLQQKKNSGSWSNAYSGGSRSKAFSGKTNASYRYRARGCNSGGCGPWSATRKVVVANAPATPGGLTVSTTGPHYKPTVHVSWNAVTGATGYSVERTPPGGGATVNSVGNVTSISELTTVSGMLTFRVRACNAAVCSPWSGYKSIFLDGMGGLGAPEEGAGPVSEEPPATQGDES